MIKEAARNSRLDRVSDDRLPDEVSNILLGNALAASTSWDDGNPRGYMHVRLRALVQVALFFIKNHV